MDDKNKGVKVISAFEFAIREAANKHSGTTEHTDGFRPRAMAEDSERLNQDLQRQLSRMQIVRPDGTREDLIQKMEPVECKHPKESEIIHPGGFRSCADCGASEI